MSFDYIHPNDITENFLQDIDFTVAGRLSIADLEIALTPSQLSTMSAWEFAHWIAIENWLTDYYLDDYDRNLDKVRGYLEAFHHLCELCEWERAWKILFLDIGFLGAKKLLHEQLFIWGHYQEQINIYKRLLNRFGSGIDCFLLNHLGRAYGYLGKTQEGISCHQQQLTLATTTNNYAAQAQAHGGLGKIYLRNVSQYEKSLFHYQQQLQIARIINDKYEELQAIFGIANAYFGCLNYQQALKFAQEALALAQTSADVDMEIEISGFIGIVYSQMGLVKQGIPLIKKKLSLSLETGNLYQQYLALFRLGVTCANLHESQTAIDYFQQAVKINDILGDPTQKPRLFSNLGSVYARLQQYEIAIDFLLAGLNSNVVVNETVAEIYIRINLAYCYTFLQKSEALEHLKIAMKIAKNSRLPALISACFAGLANYYWHQGRYIYALSLVMKSCWIYPFWKSSNGRIIFRETIKIISNSVWQMLRKLSGYFRGKRK
jgi:tetratricopeptide (TPR) repeat protein